MNLVCLLHVDVAGGDGALHGGPGAPVGVDVEPVHLPLLLLDHQSAFLFCFLFILVKKSQG